MILSVCGGVLSSYKFGKKSQKIKKNYYQIQQLLIFLYRMTSPLAILVIKNTSFILKIEVYVL